MKYKYLFIILFVVFIFVSCGGKTTYGDLKLFNSTTDTVFLWHIHYRGTLDDGMYRYKKLYTIPPNCEFVTHYSIDKNGLVVRRNEESLNAFDLEESDSLYIYLGDSLLTRCGGCLKDNPTNHYDLFSRSIWTKHKIDDEEINIEFKF